MKQLNAEILNEYGPFPGAEQVHGVTYDGQRIWFASGDKLNALDQDSGKPVDSLNVPAQAGTAFGGHYLFQIADNQVQKVDPHNGKVLGTIPVPDGCSGLAWAEGSLWVGQYQDRKILQLDPQTGEVLRSIESNRHVTGVTWLDGGLWHATWEDNDNEIRRIDSRTGEVLESIAMPQGTGISGLESDGHDRFFCGGGKSGKLRVVRYPK
ncbi:MAG: glutamine cyclotransferase [Marinobacter sp.]|uniref:Vgb family protein n=1 Tax=Marinobacter sp. TaxID=50741 RepID=UPI00329707F8